MSIYARQIQYSLHFQEVCRVSFVCHIVKLHLPSLWLCYWFLLKDAKGCLYNKLLYKKLSPQTMKWEIFTYKQPRCFCEDVAFNVPRTYGFWKENKAKSRKLPFIYHILWIQCHMYSKTKSKRMWLLEGVGSKKALVLKYLNFKFFNNW